MIYPKISTETDYKDLSFETSSIKSSLPKAPLFFLLAIGVVVGVARGVPRGVAR